MESYFRLTASKFNYCVQTTIFRSPPGYQCCILCGVRKIPRIIKLVLSADPLLIVADFNIHIDSNENYDAIKFLELLQSFSLTQHVEVATHSSGHTLDLIITRKADNLISSVPRAVCLFSDHMPVFCELIWVRYFLLNQKFRIGISRQ